MGFSFSRTRTLSLVILAFLASGAARAAEFLHMPFACRYDGVRVHLLPSENRPYQVIGPREREIYTACSPHDASRCRSWFVHRFDLDCDGARVSWLDVAEAAAREGGRDAWVEDGRFSMRMGRFWAVGRDDGPEFTRGRWRRAFDDFGPGLNDGPRARRVVTLPAGFAPALGVAIAFSGDGDVAHEGGMEPAAPPGASGPEGAPEDFADERDYVDLGPADTASEPAARAAAASPSAAPAADAAAEVAAAPAPDPIPELPQKAPPRPAASPAPPPVETAAVPGASAPLAEPEPNAKVVVVKPEAPPIAAAPEVSANAPVAATVPGTIKPVIINAPQAAVADPAPTAPAAPPSGPPAGASAETHSEVAPTPPRPQPASPTTTSSMETAASDLPPQPEPASSPVATGTRVGEIELGVAALAASAALLVLAALGAYGFWRWSQEEGLPDPPTERDIASVSFDGGPRPGRQLLGIGHAPSAARSEGAPAPPDASRGEDDLPVPTTYEQALQALGVNADATVEAIKKIVDGLRRSWHPDHAKSEADRAYREKRLRQINVAWDLVSQQRSAA